MNVSVIILTQDEEENLPDLLEGLAWCDDIHVVDSGSTDETVTIAKSGGAQLVAHAFERFGLQRNWALDHCQIKYPWVLFLDADERCTEAFQLALQKAIETASDDVAGFFCCWKLMLYGRWLKRTGYFPNWQFRLLRLGKARFTDHGHGQKEGEVLGRIEYIKEPFLHFAFAKGWSAWVERHNRYSTLEAETRLDHSASFKDIFSRRSTVRNAALKSLVSRIPGWPLLRFFHVYFLRLGFLDGTPGLIQSINVSIYEYLIKLKMREIKRRKVGKPI